MDPIYTKFTVYIYYSFFIWFNKDTLILFETFAYIYSLENEWEKYLFSMRVFEVIKVELLVHLQV